MWSAIQSRIVSLKRGFTVQYAFSGGAGTYRADIGFKSERMC